MSIERASQVEGIYDKLKHGYIESGKMEKLLKGSDISMLCDFLENWDVIQQFNRRYYADGAPKVVLCGINPGRLGAGKTGVPFIDFASLSAMLPGINRHDSERSAGFFYDVVQSIGVQTFYQHFYVTNISWVGYSHNNKNVNYDQLPSTAKAWVYEMFRLEMETISPTTIIALGGVVSDTLHECFGDTDMDISQVLPHPNYCAFPKNYEECKSRYINLLSEYIT